jgi:hypothetical protein
MLALHGMAQERSTAGTKADLIRKARLRENYGKDKALDTRPPAPSEQGWSVGTNLLSLLEEDAGPSLWAEYRFTRHLEVGLQGTWVAYNFIIHDDFNHYGFRFQPDLKYYIIPKHHSIMPFVGIGGVFTRVHYKAYTSNPDNGYGGGPDLNAGRTTFEKKQLLGYAFLFGFKKYLDGAEHRMVLEVYMGLGGKWKTFPGRSDERKRYIEDKSNSTYQATDFGFFDKFDYLKPNQYGYVPICVKFGYRF